MMQTLFLPWKTMLWLTLSIILFGTKSTWAQKDNWLKYCPDTNHVQRIDKEKLAERIRMEKKKVNVVLIYTNYCGGTRYALNNINSLRKTYGEAVQIFLCNSSPYKDIPSMLSVLKKYQVTESPVYVIDSEKYKDKKTDDRYKGKRFRDDVCRSCRLAVIGVPYTLLLDDEGLVLEAGYLNTESVRAIIELQLRKASLAWGKN